ncbi:hypothetical protein SRHO_G00005910 [Serrasalmus rhombeus]
MSHTRGTPPLSQLEVRSECHSSTSRRSSGSNVSQAAAQARPNAEAARTRAQYAKRQIDMEVEKARIEATLNALKEEGEAEAALAAAQVWEAAAEEALQPTEFVNPGILVTTPPSIRRTQEYVNAHFHNSHDVKGKETIDTGQPNSTSNHIRSDEPLLQHRPPQAPRTEISDLAAYLARRDLLTTDQFPSVGENRLMLLGFSSVYASFG